MQKFARRTVSALATGIWSALTLSAAAAPLVITDVTVINPADSTTLPNSSVVVEDGRILSVTTGKPESIPDDATVIEGRGGYLIPGLWDMHVHVSDAGDACLPVFVANGVTGIRDMGGNFERIDGWREHIRDGSLVGPHIVQAGPVVDGYKGGLPDRHIVETAEDGTKAVTALQERGVDFIKIHNAVPRPAYFALLEEAHKRGVVVAGHIPVSITPLEAIQAGQASIEHTETLIEGRLMEDLRKGEGGMFKAFAAWVDEDAPALIEQMKIHETTYTPTLIEYFSSTERSKVEKNPDPRADYIAASLRARAIKWFPARRPVVENMRKRFHASFQKMVAAMHKGGVPIMAGTDFGGRDLYPGFSLHDELAQLVESGLTPMEALRTATVNPARFLKLDTELGAIAEGYTANLVLLAEDPLEDIRNTTSIEGVVLNGRYLDRAELDGLLESAREKAATL